MIEWDEVKQLSVSPEVTERALSALRRAWPGGKVAKGTQEQDEAGADFVGSHPLFERKYYIDLKYRRRNPKYQNEKTSFAVEWWSKLPGPKQRGRIGWSLDRTKITTHILFMFDQEVDPIAYLVDFAKMKELVANKGGQWRHQYGSFVNQTVTKTGSWFSEVSFLPPEEFEYAIVNRI